MIKKILIALFCLSSFSALAGDLSLVCDNVDGNEYYLVSLVNNRATVEFFGSDIFGGWYKYNVFVEVKDSTSTYTIIRSDVEDETSKPTKYTIITYEIADYFRVSNSVACAIRD